MEGYRTRDIYTEGTKLVNTQAMGDLVAGGSSVKAKSRFFRISILVSVRDDFV